MQQKIFMILLLLVLFVFVIKDVGAMQWDNIAYWGLDQAVGQIKDLSGNGNGGSIVGSPLVGSRGKINKSIDFNNAETTNNYVNTTDIDINGSVSYSLWAIQKDGQHDSTYLSKRDRWGGTTIEITAGKKINFCIRTVSKDSKKGWTPLKHFFNTLSRVFLGNDLKTYTFWGLTELEYSCVSGTGASINEWHHIVTIYDCGANNMSLYIDGKYISSTIHETGLPSNNKSYVIGANAMGGEGWDGGKGGSEGARSKIDEVGIWSRVLNEREILELYNFGKGIPYGY